MSPQGALIAPASREILLPDLLLRQPTRVGELIHLVREGGPVAVTATGSLAISSRVTEEVLTLENGESVVITKRKSSNRPPELDGILQPLPDGGLKWAWHRKLAELEAGLGATPGEVKEEIAVTWKDALRFRAEGPNGSPAGLRPPQLGALHAIGAHWSLYRHPATVVMPTGTGKTETMLAAMVAYLGSSTTLVVVPSIVLRDQTVKKFAGLGLLRQLGVLPAESRNPIVGIVRKRPRDSSDLAFMSKCHVVIGTMASLGQGEAAPLGSLVSELVSALFVDEAHHIPAASWRAYRQHFEKNRILQFTATPFRRDGELVDGQVVYSYPLRMAQVDGYFKPISFEPIFEVDEEAGDQQIATAAVKKLSEDIEAGYDHLVMARCDSIDRARAIYSLYEAAGPQFHPVLVHSELGGSPQALAALRTGVSRIVVCVDMLGEGFDLPQLKIAAIHDTHKSLAILLQFTGRFTRSTGANLGDATVIANIANVTVSTALERLYSEDADWNHLLSEFSSDAVKQHFALMEFLRTSEAIGDEEEDDATPEISHHLLRPKFSTVAYAVEGFQAKRFFEGLPTGIAVQRVWLHQTSATLYFVTRCDPTLQWTRSRDLTDRQWDLYVLHYDPSRKLLYLHSSDTSSTHEGLAKAVGGQEASILYGDVVFRTLGRINRLQFMNIGLKKHGRRNLRYALYTGADVAAALSQAETAGSEKSNLFGMGWEGGEPITIGCSYKGRVWSRKQGTIPEFVEWAHAIGAKLQDSGIDTGAILRNVLIPTEVETVPDEIVLSIEWPIEFLHQQEERVVLSSGEDEIAISMVSLESEERRTDPNRLRFSVIGQELKEVLELELGGTAGFVVRHVEGTVFNIRVGRIAKDLAAYLSDYPPLVKFVDMSELDGNLQIQMREAQRPTIPPERFDIWDWAEIDIGNESIWKDGVERDSSIQGVVAARYQDAGFDIVFDDDAPGESADLVCLKEEDAYIRLALVHCKFSSGDAGGARVKDVVEVCAQAVRSSKWKWRFRELARHLATRERRLKKPNRETRFLTGTMSRLNQMAALSRFKEVRAEIIVVQPGLSKSGCTADQAAVLAAAHSFLKETVDVDLDVICSE